MTTNILSLTIKEVSSLLRKQALTPSDLLCLSQQRVEATKGLNAFISHTEELAKCQARESDERLSKGAPKSVLDGIPMAVKDNFNLRGTRTTCGSRMLQDYTSPYTATVVQRLMDAGAVVIGKTNMDEFAMGSGAVDSVFGPTRNPWRSRLAYQLNETQSSTSHSPLPNDDWFVTGGSSGGSAAAVASGTCFGALASDTGGSTRNPASRCGVVGFKPTYGLVSRLGLVPLTHSMDVPGIMARSVDDVSYILEIIAGHDPGDSTTLERSVSLPPLTQLPGVKGLKIGIPKEYSTPLLSPAIQTLWHHVADVFSDSGAEVTEVSMPHTEHSIVCYSILNCCEVSSNFQRYDGLEYGLQVSRETMESQLASSRKAGLSEVVLGRILAGVYFLLRKNYEKYFMQALKVRRLIAQDFQRVFREVDLLLTPVTLGPSIPHSEWRAMDNRQRASVDDFCTQAANMAGVPAISLPCQLSCDGLPLSLQLMGPNWSDHTVLQAAKWLEAQVDFPRWTMDSPEHARVPPGLRI